MRKLLIIGWKDIKLTFRDRSALILILLAPFLLTVGMGAVTGRFSGGSSEGISHIGVILINQDGKQLGNGLVETFQLEDLDELVDPVIETDPSAAYRQVDNNQAAAVLLIPEGFTDSVLPPAEDALSKDQSEANLPIQIEIYSNPTTPTSVGVVKTILDQYLSRVEVGRAGGKVTATQLLASGRIQAQQAQAVGVEMGFNQARATHQNTSITLNTITPTGKAIPFDVLALLAPGMALMFLMYTVSNGGRTILTERSQGTLPRLLVSPTTPAQALGGKMIGIYLVGVTQMLILIYGTSLIFGVQWGDNDGVQALVLAAVFAAVGWGMLITAFAHTPSQVSMMGSAVMLTFGLLGGTFINMDTMPAWFHYITRISPNSWGIDGFTTLAQGGGLQDVLVPILALLIMGSVLFSTAVFLFNRRGLMKA
jgi:ABC-2 type transport system permease protein